MVRRTTVIDSIRFRFISSCLKVIDVLLVVYSKSVGHSAYSGGTLYDVDERTPIYVARSPRLNLVYDSNAKILTF